MIDKAEVRQGALAALLGKGSIYSGVTALRTGAAVVALPIVTRLLPPAEVGLVAVGLVIQTLLAIVAAAGIPTVIVRNYFAKTNGATAAQGLVGLTAVFSAGVVGLVVATTRLWDSAVFGAEQGWWITIALCTAVPLATLNSVQAFLRCADRPRVFVGIMGLSAAGAQILGTTGAAMTGEAVGYLWGVLLGHSVACLVGVAVVKPTLAKAVRATNRGALGLAVVLIPHAVSLYLISGSDRIILEAMLGPIAAGSYHIAYSVTSLGFFALGGLNQAWGPAVYGVDPASRWDVLRITHASVNAIAALLAAIVSVSAPFGIALLAPGSDYSPTTLVPVTAVTSVALIPLATFFAASHALVWKGAITKLAIVSTTAAMLNIGANVLLIPVAGLMGAALSTVVAYMGLAVGTVVMARSRGVRLSMGAGWVAAGAVCLILVLGLYQPITGSWLVIRGIELLILSSGLAWIMLGPIRQTRRDRRRRADLMNPVV